MTIKDFQFPFFPVFPGCLFLLHRNIALGVKKTSFPNFYAIVLKSYQWQS